MRQHLHVQDSGRGGTVLEAGFGVAAGLQNQRRGTRRRARSGVGRTVIEQQGDGAGAVAVIVRRDVDLPQVRFGSGAAHADFAQSAILDGVGHQQHAQIARRRGCGRVALRRAAGADEDDFPGPAAFLLLRMARERQRLVEIQRGRARLRRLDGGFHSFVVRLERRGRSGQRIGAHQHHAVARRRRPQIIAGSLAGDLHQRPIARTSGHPSRGIEHHDVIAPRHGRRTEAHLCQGQQQQRHARQLQKERPRLVNMTPPRRHRRLFRRRPEAQGRDDLFAPRAVQKIQRHRHRGDRAKYRQHLEEGEI